MNLPMHYLVAGLLGLVSGVTSGFFGVGGGIVMVPAMVFLMASQVRDIKQAIGTSLVVIIPTALVGSFKHGHQGNINWPVALALMPTAIAGGFVGAWLTTQVHADNLKRAFGGFLVLVGFYLLLGPQVLKSR